MATLLLSSKGQLLRHPACCRRLMLVFAGAIAPRFLSEAPTPIVALKPTSVCGVLSRLTPLGFAIASGRVARRQKPTKPRKNKNAFS
jgi:hypothetical protein